MSITLRNAIAARHLFPSLTSLLDSRTAPWQAHSYSNTPNSKNSNHKEGADKDELQPPSTSANGGTPPQSTPSLEADNQPSMTTKQSEDTSGPTSTSSGGDDNNNYPQMPAAYFEQLRNMKSSTTVDRQTLAPPEMPAWQRAIANKLAEWLQTWVVDFIKARVETSFDQEEALEGAMDAFWTFHDLVSDEDFETLATMTSAKVLDAIQFTAKEFKENGLIWRTEIDPDSMSAQLRGISLMSKEQMERYDPAQAALGTDSGSFMDVPAGSWLVLSVQFRAKQLVKITREADGYVVAELTDVRPTKWKFATGPLPKNLPVRTLDTPWWLLSL